MHGYTRARFTCCRFDSRITDFPNPFLFFLFFFSVFFFSCIQATLSLLNSTNAKPPAQLTFAHISCALFINELFLIDPERMGFIGGLHAVNPQRFKLKCSVCKKAGGACVQCCDRSCRHAVHMQCALEAGYQIEIRNDTSNEGGGLYLLWCDAHRTTPRKSVVTKAAQGQVAGGGGALHRQAACQVCCYNVAPFPIEGLDNEMLCCTSCELQVHRYCYGDTASAAPLQLPGTGSTRARANPQRHGDGGAADAAATATSSGGGAAVAAAVSTSAEASPNPAAVADALVSSFSTPVRAFQCRVCEWNALRKAAGETAAAPSCALCLSPQGALKPTVDGRWVCLVRCGLPPRANVARFALPALPSCSAYTPLSLVLSSVFFLFLSYLFCCLFFPPCVQPCTYFAPELFFKNTRALEPIDGVEKAFRGAFLTQKACTHACFFRI